MSASTPAPSALPLTLQTQALTLLTALEAPDDAPPGTPPPVNTLEADIRSAVYQAAARSDSWEVYHQLQVPADNPLLFEELLERSPPKIMFAPGRCITYPAPRIHGSPPPPPRLQEMYLVARDPAERERLLLALGYAPGAGRTNATLDFGLGKDVRAQVRGWQLRR